MNDFTKEELEEIKRCVSFIINSTYTHYTSVTYTLESKIQSMIDNYKQDHWNTKKIAESHLREAESLISHAMCLLDMTEEA